MSASILRVRNGVEGTDGRGVILAPGCSIDVHAGDDNLSAVKQVVAA